MPSYGEKQKPAGKDISPAHKEIGRRNMVSNNAMLKSTLSIDNCENKGNPALLAQK